VALEATVGKNRLNLFPEELSVIVASSMSDKSEAAYESGKPEQ
jgi:hypothetical protein